jgi:hypothetical protein
VKTARILGMENAETRILRFTFFTKTNVFPFAESVGALSRKTIVNGKNLLLLYWKFE